MPSHPARAQFASDNNAGMCPEAFAALVAANNAGHVGGYGDDAYTAKASALISKLFDRECAVFFVFNGTSANALALAHLCRSYHAVICHRLSHVNEDECGAPEFFMGGGKLLAADGEHGKLTPDTIDQLGAQTGRVHSNKPGAVSITQSTELGTVYSVAEVTALAAAAKRNGLAVHMDGARFANAVASLGCHPADITWRAGVDVLSFGSTKNGLGVGEAVVFFDKTQANEFAWRMKQAGQLNSKMRLVTAPWCAMLENDIWLKNARHSNAIAQRLSSPLKNAKGVHVMHPVQANAVFVDLPVAVQAAVRAKGWRFYTFLGDTGCRLMCAWDTDAATVDRFAADLIEACKEL
jgi:threonine aldolase